MDKKRLNALLLVTFMFSLFMLWDAWERAHKPPPAPETEATNAVPGAPASASNPAAVPTATAMPAATVPTANVPKTTVQTDLYKAEISAQGGDLIFLELEKHRATLDPSKNFVLFQNDPAQHIYIGQSGLIGDGLPNHKTTFSVEKSNYVLADGQDSISVRLTAPAANGIKVAKIYTFKRDSYLIDVSYEITNTGSAAVSPYGYFQTLRDGKDAEAHNHGPFGVTTFTGPAVFTDAEHYQKVKFADIDKSKATFAHKADNGWIGMVQHYFFSAWLPQGKAEREFYIDRMDANLYRAGVKFPLATVEPGKTVTVSVPLYAGPQEQDKLEGIAPGLDRVVDYGWLTIIASPLFWVLEKLHSLIGNWGWAIIALTVMLKLIFFPLSAASYRSMAKMKAVMPLMTRLKESYKDDRAKLNQEMMELYKREKINPLGGCLPVVVQIPVFIALYWVLLGTVQMRGAPWLGWITDLSAADTLFGVIPFVNLPLGPLPLLMGATMFFQTRLNPTPPDPMQAKIMTWMPIFFTFMFLSFPAGLVLYWTVNNILSIAQQWYVTKQMETAGK
ncbi:MAG TPA: membrane protein insertase YidC [Rhodocyclaceae bacterium]|nr:membrane protein insertase YidC [Rhodocyclaceae bacterium]